MPFSHFFANQRRLAFGVLVPIIVSCGLTPASAQTPLQRITAPVSASELTTLPHNVHPLAKPEFDGGIAPPDLPMDRMLLVLNRSAEQETALENLLEAQQNPASPQYHQWLTPEQFGARFGAADSDIQTITDWLTSEGFTVHRVSKGKTIIEFSGTAGQVQQAFHTEIHKYVVNGEEHWANSADPQIPAAFAQVIAGVATMHNFLKKTQLVGSGQKFEAKLSADGKPQFTSSSGAHALAPSDYNTIYGVPNADQYGSGYYPAAIGVVARSDINLSDIMYFEEYFDTGVRGASPLTVIVNGIDPGDLGGGEEAEAVLDTSWATLVGSAVHIDLIVSKSTNSTDGVDLSEEYIIDNNKTDVMTESFGSCEANYTAAQASFYSSLAQQAAVQGITYVVAAGDSGSSGCNLGSDAVSDGRLSVNLLASNPYVTAVGGTEFDENGNDSKYWTSQNNYVQGSALSYIPEVAWNESCTASGGANPCSNGNSPGLWAGGGGASAFFAKPSWQAGVVGIPADGARDVPDISLSAAGHDPYLICLAGSCTPDTNGRISFYGYAGTSAATPAFSAFAAALVQNFGRQGLINPFLYQTAAAEALSNCNGSNFVALPATNCVFNDITSGNNSVPGEPGYDTSAGTYQTNVGYDSATGLGSVNGRNLLQALKLAVDGTPVLSLSTTSLSFGSVNIGSSKTLQVTARNSGTGVLNFTVWADSSWDQYSASNCTALMANQTCNINVIFAPTRVGTLSGAVEVDVPSGESRIPYFILLSGTGVATAEPTVAQTSLTFPAQKVSALSSTQTLTITNSTTQSVNTGALTVAGSNPHDFIMNSNCPGWLSSGANCTVYVVFMPAFAGTRSATLNFPNGDGTVTNIPLSGTGLLTGSFVILNTGTGKVLEVPDAFNRSLIEQDAFNADHPQQWQFTALPNGAYEITNVFSGKALDVVAGSLANTAQIQQWDYLGGPNQQWYLTPVDDVHYAIINLNSGKALDVPGGSLDNGTNIQQYNYLGDPQQLWVLIPAGTYSITNNASSYALGIAGASTENFAQINQVAPDALRDQQWAFVPIGGGYVAIFNRLSGKALDDSGDSLMNTTIMQQWDYLGGPNQQWQILPVDGTNFEIVNRLSGKVLDDTGFSTASGTLIQQYDWHATSNQMWQITPVTYYSIINRYSGMALDVPGAVTSDGQVIQQWWPNGYEQQQWETLELGSGYYAIVNNATSKTLDIVGASTSLGAQLDQATFSGTQDQQWELIPLAGGYYEILNLNSGKALDDSGWSLMGTTIMQQWDYLGGANQQWQLVPVPW